MPSTHPRTASLGACLCPGTPMAPCSSLAPRMATSMSTGWIPEPTEGSRHGKTLRPTAGPLVPEEGLWVQVLRCEANPGGYG